MYWPSYLMYFISDDKFFADWSSYGGLIWDMFSICSCTFSINFLAGYRVGKKLKKQKRGTSYFDIFTEMRKTMPLSFGLSAFSIFNFLFFIIIFCIAYFSSIAGNDIDQLIFDLYSWTPFIYQGLFTIMTMDINNGYLQENGRIRFQRKKAKMQVKENEAIANTVTMNVMKTAKIDTVTIKM